MGSGDMPQIIHMQGSSGCSFIRGILQTQAASPLSFIHLGVFVIPKLHRWNKTRKARQKVRLYLLLPANYSKLFQKKI